MIVRYVGLQIKLIGEIKLDTIQQEIIALLQPLFRGDFPDIEVEIHLEEKVI